MARHEAGEQATDEQAEIPKAGRILAIDPGAKRIGLAVSDPTQTLAQPLTTLTRREGKRFPLKNLKGHLKKYEPVAIVVGLPLAPNGSEDERSAATRELGTILAAKTALPVVYWDERLTTARALSAIRDLGGSVRDRKEDVDRLAATVLLQTFLDSRRR